MDSSDSNQWFHSTHWSMVLAASDSDDEKASAAMADLCQTYWKPLYSFLRRKGNSAHDAQDLTQAFFATLIDKNYLKSVAPEKGRFRSFLLVAIRNFASKQRDYDRAVKRGGRHKRLALDYTEAERFFEASSHGTSTPEEEFEYNWAITVLGQTVDTLKDEFAAAGKSEEFEHLKCFLVPSGELPTFKQLGEALGLAETGARSAVHRLRRRYRKTLRTQVAQTVDREEDIDCELQDLLNILGRK